MNGTRVGYARCSTDEQDAIIQTEQLLTLGVPEDRFYIDRGFSGTTRRNRAGLDQALAAVWDGSVFTVTKFDRFARNMAEANQTLTDLSGRGVLFGLGASVYDWNDPFGRLFLQTLAMVAESEATLGHMRSREGMAPAKKGKLKSKQPKLPEPARRSIRWRYAEGEVSLASLAPECSLRGRGSGWALRSGTSGPDIGRSEQRAYRRSRCRIGVRGTHEATLCEDRDRRWGIPGRHHHGFGGHRGGQGISTDAVPKSFSHGSAADMPGHGADAPHHQ
ncbi:recombinase family protein [Nonomuraea jabiensis]|uniref:recombinase family protein n=1 Tax=Nonomuraea jabiensis TaxID=882448 RepID=UPI0036A3AE55